VSVLELSSSEFHVKVKLLAAVRAFAGVIDQILFMPVFPFNVACEPVTRVTLTDPRFSAAEPKVNPIPPKAEPEPLPTDLVVAKLPITYLPASSPIRVALLPSVNVLDPVVRFPFVRVIVPFSVIPELSVRPLELFNVTFAFDPNVKVPEFVIDCAVAPANVIVFAEAGLKVKVCPDATVMFPFIVIPPVKFKLRTPFEIVRLSIDNADEPVALWEKPA